MNINEMTRKQFDDLPSRKWDEETKPFRSMVILPGRIKDMHDSGYRCMDFVAVGKDDEPICRLSGCSDVIHIDGIGGYGKDWYKKYGTVPKGMKPRGWNIDCLPKSGLLRIFCANGMTAGLALSSFEIYSEEARAAL